MIVLLTDFGESEYVGMMKGVIRSICSEVEIIDLTHSIRPQSVIEGAWVLFQSYRYFPSGATFVCVVDPGVGTGRVPVLVKTKNYVFIGPDNGLLYPATHHDGIEQIFDIVIDEPVSNTFHGRDVFAKIAALFKANATDKKLVSIREGLTVPLGFHLDGRTGQVVRIDRFGNIVTNLSPLHHITYTLKSSKFERKLDLHKTYAEGPEDDVFLVVGSSGTLEIAYKNGSAHSMMDLNPGNHVTIS